MNKMDFMTTTNIHVTQDDIAHGHKHSGEMCPIALAMRRCLSVHSAHVGPSYAYVMDSQRRCLGRIEPLPVSARTFILNFDRGISVRPFEFEVTL